MSPPHSLTQRVRANGRIRTPTQPLFLIFLFLILLRSRTFTLPLSLLTTIRSLLSSIGVGGALKKDKTVSQDELARVLQQVYIQNEDGSKTLLVPYRERIVKVPIREIEEGRFIKDRVLFPGPSPLPISSKLPSFTHQLRTLLTLTIPSLHSREVAIILLHSSFLILRTILSILVARLDGKIVRDIVKADGKGFLKGLGMWFALGVPSTFTNSMIRHLQSLLSLRLRTNLTRYLHDLYLSKHPHLRYYRANTGAGLGPSSSHAASGASPQGSSGAASGASSSGTATGSASGSGSSTSQVAPSAQLQAIEGIDQYLTADVEAWAAALSGLYGNILKPTLDLLLFTSQLSLSLGLRGTSLLFLNYYATILILRYASPSGTTLSSSSNGKSQTPSFGVLSREEMRLEGEYRMAVGRVGREAEEVAFYDGGGRERRVLVGSGDGDGDGKEGGVYGRLRKHLGRSYKIRIAYEWTEDYVIKYLWSAAGYALIAVPILYTRTRRSSAATSTSLVGSTSANVGSANKVGKGGQAARVAAVGVAAGVASVVGGMAGAAGAMGGGGRDEQIAGRTETYISSRRLLLNLADAGGRLMYAYKDLLELKGLTGRLYELVGVLVWIGAEKEGENKEKIPLVEMGDEIRLEDVSVYVPGSSSSALPHAPGQATSSNEKQTDEDRTPQTDVQVHHPPLVKSLNLSIKQGQHTLITGSNGVGKTAVARVLGGLWDVGGGFVHMPKDSSEVETFLNVPTSSAGPSTTSNARGSNRPRPRPRPTLYVLPQRSYMPIGSLLEQIIYPCSYAQFIKLTASNEERPLPTRSKSFLSRSLASLTSLPSLPSLTSLPSLSRGASLTQTLSSTPLPSRAALAEIHTILDMVHLGYLVEREGGLHARKEWRDVLSGGEKQRMGMARVLWWRPRWAVLDECTSAVSSDVEGRMYEAAKSMGITLITISLRPSLAKYHTQLLTLHGPSPSHTHPIATSATSPSTTSPAQSSQPSSPLPTPGSWTLSVIGTPEERLSLTNEIRSLEERLSEVEGWERRVKELEGMLSVQEGVESEIRSESESEIGTETEEDMGGSVVDVGSEEIGV